MSYKLDQLEKQKDDVLFKANNLLTADNIEHHLFEIQQEYNRVNQIAGQAAVILDQIDKEFKEKTKLSSTDIIILFLCTAIQCARQYILTNDKFRLKDDVSPDGKKIKFSNQKGDELIESVYDKTAGLLAPPSWKDVLFRSVPYDAFKTSTHAADTGLSGTTHRFRTLGHDPVLGWIFGTANIMTNSLTKHNLETFQVKNMTIIRHYPLGVAGMLEKSMQFAMRDQKLLAASVARQAIHFGSDIFTKQGLPVPLIMTVNNDLAKDMLSKWHIDTWTVVRGGAISAFINQLIFCIHQLFYQGEVDGSPEQYEVRTRKILSYSNLLASGSNVIVTAVSENLSKLDIGGLLVTLYRLISDYKFIHAVKREFLEKEFYKKIVGEPYDFVRRYNNV